MIIGLQAKVPGCDVIKFALEQAAVHRAKAEHYRKQVDALAAAGIDSTSNSSDPKAGALSKVSTHIQSADELEFLVQYLEPTEVYVLTQADLHKLGKVSRGY